ncbi:MAG: hypothetical protein JSW30_05860 [Dehalococcoidia bacterium]|nr:MAG: hypothetical protein JSW30_05860 [Dehalococcoidia bacterium]
MVAKGHEVENALGKRRLDFTKEQMARYAEYCRNDADLTYKLFTKLAPQFPISELNLIDLTIRMFSEPVLGLDKCVLEDHLTSVRQKKEKLMAAVSADKSVIMSNPQLASLLEKMGVEVPMKVSPTTGKETFAFAKSDEGFKALLEHDDPKVQAVVAARLGVKSTLEETRTERFIGIADRGTLPIPLRYYAAHTGRWGGDDKVNMQNLPRGSQLKNAILAPTGHVLVDCDSSQIEARTLAWLAGQDDLVGAFDKGEDVYKIMASKIYGKLVEDINKDERFIGKTTVLGAGYGMGAAKFQAQLKTMGVELTEGECTHIINVYREQYTKIPALWSQAGRALNTMVNNNAMPDKAPKTSKVGKKDVLIVRKSEIELPNGLTLKYPNIRSELDPKTQQYETVYDTKKGRAKIRTRIYGGKCVENICQALARIIIGEQMLMVSRRYKVAMTVHDAVVAVVPEDEAEEGRAFVEQCMRMRPKWASGLPLNCESKIGASYGG